MIILETSKGNITLQLDFDKTPNTANNFKQLVASGYYDGTIFHRVIPGFMIQGGGFTTNMVQKEDTATIKNEADLSESNNKGTIAMARTPDPHSASSQFFINTVDNAFLNFKSKNSDGWGYCVFGNVADGMAVVEAIQKVNTGPTAGHQDVPKDDVTIVKAYLQE